MEEDEQAPGVNFIPCVKWIRRGIAKANPEKVQLTEDELESIINKTKDKLKVEDGSDDEGSSDENKTPKMSKPEDEDKFDLNNYDDENDTPDILLDIGNVVVQTSGNDPDVMIKDEDDLDSERGDDVISTADNLILVAHVEGDISILEVYIYNEDEGSLYVHHDLLLPSFPLCLEWLSFDPEEASPGNLCAVGTMDSVIQVWDLDLLDCLEPAFKLGRKARRKKGIKGVGHTDAVLDLSWNKHLPHIMASGSADHTVLLWDIENGAPATKLAMFKEKVQSLQFHPFEAETLVSGCCDKEVRVFDCRHDGSFKAWSLPGEVERVIWNHLDPYYCIASTSVGSVHYIDCRMDTVLWQISAHDKEVTGLALSSQCPGLLMTAGTDALLKTWDISDNTAPVFVSERPLNIGVVHCIDACPESPFVICAGGDKKSHNFGVWDVTANSSDVVNRFGSRPLVKPVVVKEEAATSEATMDTTESSLDQEQPSTSAGVRRTPKGGKKREKRK